MSRVKDALIDAAETWMVALGHPLTDSDAFDAIQGAIQDGLIRVDGLPL